MRIAALYDIHGNLPALRAVLAEAAREGVERFVIGGDVAAGPLPSETIDELIALGERAYFVCGNADREVIEAFDARSTEAAVEDDPAARTAVYVASRITRTQRDFLAGFAPTVRLALGGLGPTLFCHGSPRSDSEIVTRLTAPERLREILSNVEEHVIVGGHTHQQFDRPLDRWRLINAGSVGMPYEGRRGAYWARLDRDVELRRTEYDVDEALSELRAGAFPGLDEMFSESLLDPVDPAEVSEFFEHQAQRAQSADPER